MAKKLPARSRPRSVPSRRSSGGGQKLQKAIEIGNRALQRVRKIKAEAKEAERTHAMMAVVTGPAGGAAGAVIDRYVHADGSLVAGLLLAGAGAATGQPSVATVGSGMLAARAYQFVSSRLSDM